MSDRSIFKKVLMPVTGVEDEDKVIDYIAEHVDEESVLFLVFIVDETQINQIARVLKKEPVEVRVDIEEKGWRSLYYLEEKLQENEIRSNIQMLTGHPAELIKKLIMRLHITMLLMMKKSGKGIAGRAEEKLIEDLINHIEIPILII